MEMQRMMAVSNLQRQERLASKTMAVPGPFVAYTNASQ